MMTVCDCVYSSFLGFLLSANSSLYTDNGSSVKKQSSPAGLFSRRLYIFSASFHSLFIYSFVSACNLLRNNSPVSCTPVELPRGKLFSYPVSALRPEVAVSVCINVLSRIRQWKGFSKLMTGHTYYL